MTTIEKRTHLLSLISKYGSANYGEGYADASKEPEKARKHMEKRKDLAKEVIEYFDRNFQERGE